MVNTPAWMNEPDKLWEFTQILAKRTDGRCYIVQWAGLSGNNRPWPFSEAIREYVVNENELEQEWAGRKLKLGASSNVITHPFGVYANTIHLSIGDAAFYHKEDVAKKICALKKAGKDRA
jgi:hypothetical protein